MNEIELMTAINKLKLELVEDIGFNHIGVIEEYTDSIVNLITLFFDPRTVEPNSGVRKEKR